ncbi:metal ABC transporter solute-binding protein, Zn/Mn family [Sinobaca sp. H24]|uniref:metal ABC transporter solute-binding protein, Zn/Mn family n=1 Tax=Sinobaca sp. H24 TaxID=2923376 RepID=UPI00207A2880|nr:zinc ABC transporter substrate-binding protein [Sinobaca sp. H24]
MKKTLLYSLITGASLAMAACGGSNEEDSEASGDQDEALQVYTTLYAWEYVTERIGGEHVEVNNIVPAGTDVHNFEPTAQTMVDIAESDLFVYTGAGMEGFAGAINDSIENEDVTSLEVTNGMELASYEHDHSHAEEDNHSEEEHAHEEEEEHSEEEHAEEEESHGDQDPHVWLDPALTKEAAETIKNELASKNPEQEAVFQENYDALSEELDSLDSDFSEMASSSEKDSFLVSHAGYGYWEERYDIHQIGISGLSPSNEPSQRQIQEIIALAEENNLNYVMVEQNIPSNTADVVQDETGAEALELHNLESLSEEEINSGEDYFSLMEKNVSNLDQALNN